MNTKTKPNLVLVHDASFLGEIRQQLEQYFDIIDGYDPAITYDTKSTLIVMHPFRKSEFHQQILDSGAKIVIDSLCEPTFYCKKNYPELTDALVLSNTNWFWYRENVHNRQILDINKYVPNRTYTYTALMPMHVRRPHRDRLLTVMYPFLDSFIWSYVGKPELGRHLPNDNELQNGILTNDRYFNSEWYDTTCFSLVAETATELPDQEMFITEKTFKPIAFQHPFMIFGLQFTLKYLKSQGFETFENLFDESYDSEIDEVKRLAIIKNNVEQYKNIPYDSITEQKILHNHNHFYNTDLIKTRIRNEICEPLIDYVNTR
jgi:hypothetical protein